MRISSVLSRFLISFVRQRGWVSPTGPLLLLAAVGCTAGPPAYYPYWPFEPPDRTSYETPDKRIAKLRAMADEAPEADLAEQERLVARLAEQYGAEHDPLARAEIVRTAAFYQHPAAGRLFERSAQDAVPAVRIACCAAVARRGGPLAVPLLARILNQDADIDVQLAATRAMAQFSDPEAVEALSVALDSPDPALQYRAMQSLRSMTGRDYGNDTSAWRQYVRSGEHLSPPPRSTIAERLRQLF